MRLPIQAIANSQLFFLIAFISLNVALVAVATDNTVEGETISATFFQAADGQKYWGVATSLIDSGTFSIPQEDNQPLAKAGPLVPLVFAVFIKLSNLASSAVLIVTFQCCLLFVISLYSRSIANYFGAPPNLVQALVLFNPNLIGLCHLAQSDILFAFLFTSFTWIVIHKLFNTISIDKKSFLLLGGVLGLMMLTRDVGKIFAIIVIPLIFLCVYFQNLVPRSHWRYLLTNLAVAACIACLIYSPWMVRNVIVLSQPTAMSIEGQLRDNYGVLISHRDSISVEQVDDEAWGETSPLSPVTMGGGCADSTPFLLCFVSAVFEEDLKVIAKAVVSSLSGTLLAGGASALANYIGIETTGPPSYSGYITIDRYPWFISTLFEGKHRHYLWLVILTSAFAITLRLAGVIGYFSKLKSGHQTMAAIFLLLCMILFLAMYLFYGVSRFRAPFEPILMIFGAIGLVTVKNRIQQFFSTCH